MDDDDDHHYSNLYVVGENDLIYNDPLVVGHVPSQNNNALEVDLLSNKTATTTFGLGVAGNNRQRSFSPPFKV